MVMIAERQPDGIDIWREYRRRTDVALAKIVEARLLELIGKRRQGAR